MLVGKITAIGEHAITQKDPIIILFGEQATEDLRTVSIIQSFEKDKERVDLKPGQTITFDEQVYTILEVGALANENLNTIGHVTLNFSEVPEEDKLASGIYLEPFTLPKVAVGTTIHYAK
ncbi:MAG: PTS glucitol/sorbitol transporter subunit IIA [Carnobacterium sp.]|nr:MULTISPECIES: PTS glucitol/sorbitol transporter subunit IIA [unclassified Carnobacterium]ALV21716.1 PTS system, glucitol/sorbitol-specific IIA component [Carnobacterium sp. CP1]QQP69724.1 PTS glucitol/sorbitol transporter subunit IIA [Carnobacterium sp. CS13]